MLFYHREHREEAGLLLVRYPMLQRPGIYLIEAGLGYIGIEYLKDCISYLKERGLITGNEQEKLEDVVSKRH
jgi:hypothetical protein